MRPGVEGNTVRIVYFLNDLNWVSHSFLQKQAETPASVYHFLPTQARGAVNIRWGSPDKGCHELPRGQPPWLILLAVLNLLAL